jgi:hypothetical protein
VDQFAIRAPARNEGGALTGKSGRFRHTYLRLFFPGCISYEGRGPALRKGSGRINEPAKLYGLSVLSHLLNNPAQFLSYPKSLEILGS